MVELGPDLFERMPFTVLAERAGVCLVGDALGTAHLWNAEKVKEIKDYRVYTGSNNPVFVEPRKVRWDAAEFCTPILDGECRLAPAFPVTRFDVETIFPKHWYMNGRQIKVRAGYGQKTKRWAVWEESPLDQLRQCEARDVIGDADHVDVRVPKNVWNRVRFP